MTGDRDDQRERLSLDTRAEARTVLLRRGLRLEYATLGWNVVGIGVTVVAALAARSVALAGFSLDSGVEMFASIVVIRELTGTSTAASQHRAERRIGVAFLALAAYLVGQAIVTVAAHVHPDSSPLGIGWLAATAFAMFALAYGKASTGRALDHQVLRTEARITVIDGVLASATFAGLAINAATSWWWADLAAAAVIVVYGFREGVHLLKEPS